MAKNPIGPSSPADDVLFPIQPIARAFTCPYCGRRSFLQGGHVACQVEASNFIEEKIDSLKSEEE